MSAIAGLCRFRDPAPVKADLERQARALRDHGRDGGGTWHREGAGLAQCLQRFTPEDLFERQPLKSADGHRVLVADARIDNREALADAFGWSPAEARLRPDSAFLLHAYETWGEACPAELLGSFAFAVWDTRRRSLFAAVDPLGTRQLYYHRAPGRFAFATTPAGLFALPEVPRELDPAGLAQRLVLSGAGFDTTVFRGIERLPGGHRMRVTEAGVERVRYWRLDPHREIRLPSDDAYLQAFEEQF